MRVVTRTEARVLVFSAAVIAAAVVTMIDGNIPAIVGRKLAWRGADLKTWALLYGGIFLVQIAVCPFAAMAAYKLGWTRWPGWVRFAAPVLFADVFFGLVAALILDRPPSRETLVDAAGIAVFFMIQTVPASLALWSVWRLMRLRDTV